MNISSAGIAHKLGFSEVGITDGLVGWWPLNGNANDLSGNSNNGSVSGAIVSSGLDQLCYSFDGVDDYISFNVISSTTRTQSGWFYLTQTASSKANPNYLFNNFYQHNANNYLYFLGTSDYFSVGFTTINTWYHIALVFTDKTLTSSSTLYVNGVQKAIVIQTGSHAIFDVNTISGSTSGIAFPGLVQDVRIYNRALSAEEVQILYDLGNPATNIKTKNGKNTVYVKGEFNELL
jgi:hypothetical protein